MTYIKCFTTIILLSVSLYCLGQNVTITSQAEMDAFDSGTTVITGYLDINGNNSNDPITDLNNLSNLASIGGDLNITYNTVFTDMDGLSNLASIGGGLLIGSNTSLTNIDDLSSLASIGGGLVMESNPFLANTNGLSNLNSIGGDLVIVSNPSLTNINGLSSLNSFTGDLNIENNDVLTNIDGLSNLNTIGGDLMIENNSSLTNIDGLSNMTSVSRHLNIQFNNALTDMDGLSSITSIGRNLMVTNNNILTNLDGLSNLNSINEHLHIINNFSLADIDGLSNVTSIGGDFKITHNSFLANINGLSNLNSIGGDFRMAGNNDLTDIPGLSNLNSVGGYLAVDSNNALTNMDGLSSLTSIGEYLVIQLNDGLTNVDGLSNITSVSGDLQLANNSSLTNINALSNITSIGEDLHLLNNPFLTNINGLSNITSVGGELIILYNNGLTNMDGLSNLASIGENLIIKNNPNLTNCCGIQNLLNTTGAISGIIDILNNPSECSSESAILSAAICGLSIKVFNDFNQDCMDGNTETGIANRQLMIQPGNIIGETNIAGRWYPDTLPAGDYTITIDTSGTWSPTCPGTQSFTVANPFEETIMPSFGLVSTEPCAAPDISIHMPFMRPCFENQKIYIQACNTSDATGVLEDAFVVVELDSLLMPTSSSIPYTDLGNHMYQFDIGTLNPGICADFRIETTLGCSAVLGQGLCMEARLFPAEDCVFDDIPNPIPDCNTIWDMSSLSVEGYCENDSILFEITNGGSGDMTCFSPVRIYINGNLIIPDSVRLVSGEIARFGFSADGQSWRLETDQHPLHPGNSQPNAMVENCGQTDNSSSSFVNAAPLDDADPVVDIYCGTVTGSYDPNDKTGFPLGINESNDILPNQKIEYLIRFQNTGTDTAFTVVIRDTLSADFDIFSVQSGAASHSYDFTTNDSRAMEWTFNNILLPDSTTNEAGSHGFITFTVNQMPDLSEGATLENTAAIYFDFNDPIITNTYRHTINYFTPNIIATTNINEEACNDYASPSGNYTWSHSGTYYDVIETANGDSIIIVDLTVASETINPTITDIGGSTLTANIPNAEYQWLDCNDNSNPIEGATDQDFTTVETIGDYAVQVTVGECAVISDCFHLNATGTTDYEFANAVSIQPNPTNGHVSVDLGENHEATSFTLRNILGQTILKQAMNTSDEFHFEINGAAGLYLLEIETNSGQNATFKIFKN